MAAKGFYSSFDDVWMIDGVPTPMVDHCRAFGDLSACGGGQGIALLLEDRDASN